MEVERHLRCASARSWEATLSNPSEYGVAVRLEVSVAKAGSGVRRWRWSGDRARRPEGARAIGDPPLLNHQQPSSLAISAPVTARFAPSPNVVSLSCYFCSD